MCSNMLMLVQVFLFCSLIQLCHSLSDVVPNSGLVIGYTEFNQPVALKILEKINSPVTCDAIRLNNSLPSVIKKNGNIFYLIDETDIYYHLYEGYNIYKNRNNQYLSYIFNGGSFGTWIIGDSPHVDNGLAYVRPSESYSWLPITMNKYDNEKVKDSWYMTSTAGVWSEINGVTSECTDNVLYGDRVYKVQYLDNFEEETPLYYSHVIPTLKAVERLQVQMTKGGANDAILKCLSTKSDLCMYHAFKRIWIPLYLTKQTQVYPMGKPVSISHKVMDYRAIGSIVNIEYLSEIHKFRLYIRVTMANIANSTYMHTTGSSNTDLHYIYNNYIKYLYTPISDISTSDRDDLLVIEVGLNVVAYEYESITANIGLDLIQYEIGTMYGYELDCIDTRSESGMEMKSKSKLLERYNKQLYNILPTSTGVGATIASTSTISDMVMPGVGHAVSPIDIGDYVWVWIDDGRKYRDILAKCIDIIYTTHEFSSFLSIENRKYIFSYTVSDRREIMERSVLDMELNRLVLDIDITPRKEGLFDISRLNAFFTGVVSNTNNDIYSHTPVRLLSIHNFNGIESLVGYVKKYIANEEKRYGSHLSSCYFYHGGVALPQQLVYAAELVCVLVGSKPISMIQYATPTDFQWKFPIVREIVNIFYKSQFHGENMLAYHTNIYYKDSSLIVYHTSLQRLADLLGPNNRTTQALHPVPYPNNYVSENTGKKSEIILRKIANEQQIYYSWWNGYVLGYPIYSIDEYCKSFHNDLDEYEKIKISRKAQKDIISYMKTNNITAVPIGIGALKEIPLKFYKYLDSKLPY